MCVCLVMNTFISPTGVTRYAQRGSQSTQRGSIIYLQFLSPISQLDCIRVFSLYLWIAKERERRDLCPRADLFFEKLSSTGIPQSYTLAHPHLFFFLVWGGDSPPPYAVMVVSNGIAYVNIRLKAARTDRLLKK